MWVDVLGKVLHSFLYGRIHGLLHLLEGQYRWVVDRCKGLLGLRRLFEEVHGGLEIILRAGARCATLLVQYLEEDIVLLGHVIWTSTAVLDRSRGADVGRGLRKERRVEFVIS